MKMAAPGAMRGSGDVIPEPSSFTTDRFIMSHPHFSDGYDSTTLENKFEMHEMQEIAVEIGFPTWILVSIPIVALVVLVICFFCFRSLFRKRRARRNKKDVCMKSSTYKKVQPDMYKLTKDSEESVEDESKYIV